MTDLDLDDEARAAIRGLAADLFGRVDAGRVEKAEAAHDRFDRELWAALAETGLLGVAVSEDLGGLGLGAPELALVLTELGRAVAPVPLVDVNLAGRIIATHAPEGSRRQLLSGLLDGSSIVAVAAPTSCIGLRADGDVVVGTARAIPWAHLADQVLLPVGSDVHLVATPAEGLGRTTGETTARTLAADLTLDRVPGVTLPGAAAVLRRWQGVALAAVQAGVTDAAVRMTAQYTSQREQFGKPLSTFQAVALKAADAYLDATAVRATVLQAAWALETQEDPTLPVLTAAWWAAEGGQRCVHLTQHLHGGMGADVTYPAHRYFLWAKQVELLLGGASALLAELGDALSDRPDAGDAVVV